MSVINSFTILIFLQRKDRRNMDQTVNSLKNKGKQRGYLCSFEIVDEVFADFTTDDFDAINTDDLLEGIISKLELDGIQIFYIKNVEEENKEGRKFRIRTRECTKCGVRKIRTDDYFNLLPSGSLRRVCKSCMAANTRKHYQKNPEKVKARVKKYKDQLKNSEGYHTEADIQNIRLQQKDKCAYCGKNLSGRGEIDHKIPISRGGSDWPDNLALACRKCNRDKHNKTVEEFKVWNSKR
jgi:hypothetical protein